MESHSNSMIKKEKSQISFLFTRQTDLCLIFNNLLTTYFFMLHGFFNIFGNMCCDFSFRDILEIKSFKRTGQPLRRHKVRWLNKMAMISFSGLGNLNNRIFRSSLSYFYEYLLRWRIWYWTFNHKND